MQTRLIHGVGAIWGRSALDVYAANDKGSIFHYDGSTWAPIRTQTTEPCTHIAGYGDKTVFLRSGRLIQLTLPPPNSACTSNTLTAAYPGSHDSP